MCSNDSTFSISQIELLGVPILNVVGDVDAAAGRVLREWLENLASQRYRRIGLDLGRVTHVDASAMEVLTEINSRMQPERRRLYVVAASPSVRCSLEAHGLGFMVVAQEVIPHLTVPR